MWVGTATLGAFWFPPPTPRASPGHPHLPHAPAVASVTQSKTSSQPACAAFSTIETITYGSPYGCPATICCAPASTTATACNALAWWSARRARTPPDRLCRAPSSPCRRPLCHRGPARRLQAPAVVQPGARGPHRAADHRGHAAVQARLPGPGACAPLPCHAHSRTPALTVVRCPPVPPPPPPLALLLLLLLQLLTAHAHAAYVCIRVRVEGAGRGGKHVNSLV